VRGSEKEGKQKGREEGWKGDRWKENKKEGER
jgi:hypothetical protein